MTALPGNGQACEDRAPARAHARLRPTVHFTPAEGWINDPYGITWDGEQYHLFYQAIPGRVTWAPNCHWGHAVSPDLVHWTERPLALTPAASEVGCWSGSAVLDATPPALLYTRIAGHDWGQGQVALAKPTPDGQSWDTTAAQVLIDGPPEGVEVYAFRDPYLWRTEDGWRLLMAAGLADGSGAALQYRSPDLRTWHYDGVLAQRHVSEESGAWTGALWECPQLFPLGDTWVLLVSVWNDDILHYVAGAIGDYDGTQFTARSWQRLTYGSSAYAMTAFTDRHGRRCVLSWLREEPQNDPTLVGFAGAHSLAATISIIDDQLALTPHPDVEDLQAPLDDCDAIPTNVALSVTVDTGSWTELRLSVGNDDRLVVRQLADAVLVERPGLSTELLPFHTAAGRLRLVLDADLLEVFAPRSYGAYRIAPAADPQHRLHLVGRAQVTTLAR